MRKKQFFYGLLCIVFFVSCKSIPYKEFDSQPTVDTIPLIGDTGLQFVINYGGGTVNPYEIIGNLHKIENGKIKRVAGKPFLKDNVVLDTEAKSILLCSSSYCNVGGNLDVEILENSITVNNESKIEIKATKIADIKPRTDTAINWENLKDYYSLGNHYAIITSMSIVEITACEYKKYDTKTNISISVVKIDGDFYQETNNTKTSLSVIANLSYLDPDLLKTVKFEKDSINLKPLEGDEKKSLIEILSNNTKPSIIKFSPDLIKKPIFIDKSIFINK